MCLLCQTSTEYFEEYYREYYHSLSNLESNLEPLLSLNETEMCHNCQAKINELKIKANNQFLKDIGSLENDYEISV